MTGNVYSNGFGVGVGSGHWQLALFY